MCGIKFSLWCCEKCKNKFKTKSQSSLPHRGPDQYNEALTDKFFMSFDRLSLINTSTDGLQPFINNDSFFVCNGEIYNYKSLSKEGDKEEKNDCKVIFDILVKNDTNPFFITKFLKEKVNGEFAFIYYNQSKDILIAARDDFGVRPLYITERKCDDKESFFISLSSEIKGLDFIDSPIFHFKPGYMYYKNSNISSSFQHCFFGRNLNVVKKDEKFSIRNILIESVKKRIFHMDDTSESRFGCLLSGGLDSSLITTIAFKELSEKYGLEYAQKNLYVFSIYYLTELDEPNSFPDDIKYAKELCHSLNITNHYIFSFSLQDVRDNLLNVIKSIETYDITTIRASLPQYILALKIKSLFPFIKFVLSGEGADEIFGGYKYLKGIFNNDFYSYPEQLTIFNEECIKLINNIHYFDGNRTDKTLSSSSIEVRIPFLDKEVVYGVFSNISVEERNPIRERKNSESFSFPLEKLALREPFKDYLIDSVLMRPKEAFSDSVCKEHSLNWFNVIFENVEVEKRFYREVFNLFYNYKLSKCIIPHYWLPDERFTNGVAVKDPSAKIL